MSQENVEIVRHLYEDGLIDPDPEELLELATPDVEYVNPRTSGLSKPPGCPIRRPFA